MAHPQNSPRGLFRKKNIGVVDGGNLYLEGFAKTTGILYGTEVGLVTAGSGIKFSSPRSSSTLPSANRGASLCMIVNTTGETALAINTTGATWKYFAVTGVLRTANVSN